MVNITAHHAAGADHGEPGIFFLSFLYFVDKCLLLADKIREFFCVGIQDFAIRGKLSADLCPLLSAAESMQGTVKGENRPEGGAVFTLTLQRPS